MKKIFTLILLLFLLQHYSNAQIDLSGISGYGSGFIVSPDGYLVTNYHVVEGASSIKVHQKNKENQIAKVVRFDEKNDVAVLKIECNNCPYVNVKSSSNTSKGEKVFALGYPKVNLQGFESKLTEGIISSLSGFKDQPSDFQISNPIQPGNSGGPLFNESGEVIGVVVGYLKESQNVNYAIKSNYFIELLNSIDNNIIKDSLNRKTSNKKFTTTVSDIDKATVLILVVSKNEAGQKSKASKPSTDIRKYSKLPNCTGKQPQNWNNCYGEYEYPNGNFYKGEFQNGVRDGLGLLKVVVIGESDENTIRSPKPATYIGKFQNGKLNGKGWWIFDSGETIEGEFKNNILVKRN